MKALTVVGNYTQNYRNSPEADMSQIYEGLNSWNPNFQEGYVGIMIAAYYYFGGIDATTPDAVNQVLADFSYDEYIAQMDTYDFNSMKTYFEATGKTLLETGGTDANGGRVYGAKIPFTYRGKNEQNIPYDPILIYQHLEKKM